MGGMLYLPALLSYKSFVPAKDLAGAARGVPRLKNAVSNVCRRGI